MPPVRVFRLLPPAAAGLALPALLLAAPLRAGAGAGAPPVPPADAETSEVVEVNAERPPLELYDLTVPVHGLLGIAGAASEGVVTADDLAGRPSRRSGDLLEAVPGVLISQHSGEGKANQYYLRGFNLDHGTDFATFVDGVPVNLPTHAHGQGYADLNFLIPELVQAIEYRKGPYDARQGDFSAAGSAQFTSRDSLDAPLLKLEAGQLGDRRLLAAASPEWAGGRLLAAVEWVRRDGPWEIPDAYRKYNALLRYRREAGPDRFTLTVMGYSGRWHSTDQAPERAIADGRLGRFGAVDPSDGGASSRASLAAEWRHLGRTSVTAVRAWGLRYRLDLFSNFTYFLDDPANGDQFAQADRRLAGGFSATHSRRFHGLGGDHDLTLGAQLRRDAISPVGLYRTAARERLETVREDRVTQTSGALFAESTQRWTPWLRTTAGLRADEYRFRVEANLPANSGFARATLVSPKAGLALGPWAGFEFYLNWGTGFHSNDGRGATLTVDPASGAPAGRVTPLVRARGREAGARFSRGTCRATAALWRLDLDSELVFSGDAGSTDAGRPSARQGFEWSGECAAGRFSISGDLALSKARFTDADPVGDHIPGALGRVIGAGIAYRDPAGRSGALRLRHLGGRPLIEDDSIRSSAATTLDGEARWPFSPAAALELQGFNLLGSRASDIDYFYVSRLPGEPAAGVADRHTHPLEPRALRLSLSLSF